MHNHNKEKDILILGNDPAQELDSTTLTAEKEFSIDFTESKKKFCLSLRYNGTNIYLLMAEKCINLKQKILKL